jgi:hypothetical protein
LSWHSPHFALPIKWFGGLGGASGGGAGISGGVVATLGCVAFDALPGDPLELGPRRSRTTITAATALPARIAMTASRFTVPDERGAGDDVVCAAGSGAAVLGRELFADFVGDELSSFDVSAPDLAVVAGELGDTELSSFDVSAPDEVGAELSAVVSTTAFDAVPELSAGSAFVGALSVVDVSATVSAAAGSLAADVGTGVDSFGFGDARDDFVRDAFAVDDFAVARDRLRLRVTSRWYHDRY